MGSSRATPPPAVPSSTLPVSCACCSCDAHRARHSRDADPSGVAEAVRRRGGLCHVSHLASDGISADRVQRAATRGEVTDPARAGTWSERRIPTSWRRCSQAARSAASRPCGCMASGRSTSTDFTSGCDEVLTRVRPMDFAQHWRARRIIGRSIRYWMRRDAPRAASPFEQAVATIDSALHLGLSDPDRPWGARCAAAKLARLRGFAQRIGPESLARVRLRRLPDSGTTQVRIPGVGRVDF